MRKIAYLLSLSVVFMIPWENAVTFGEWGTLSRVVGMVTAVAWLSSLLFQRRIRRLHPFHMAILIFLIWNIASIFWSLVADQTISRVKTYAQLALLSWIFWDLLDSPRALLAALQAYILGAYVTVGSTIYNYRAGTEISAFSEGRYAGAGLNAVDLALILALGLPVALHLGTSPGKGGRAQFMRIVNLAFVPAALFAMTLTASRMSLFVVIPVVVYGIFVARQLQPSYRHLLLAFLVVVLPVLAYQIPETALERLGTTSQSVSSFDLGGRVRLWFITIRIFAQHPLLGVGSGALHPPSVIGHVVHNTYLSVATELGVIGFFVFAIMLAIVVHEAASQTKRMSWLWLTILAVWAIGSLILTWEFTKQTWLFLNLVVISAALFDQHDVTHLGQTMRERSDIPLVSKLVFSSNPLSKRS